MVNRYQIKIRFPELSGAPFGIYEQEGDKMEKN